MFRHPESAVAHLPQLAALLGELHSLGGAVNQLDGDAHHCFQLLRRVPYQQHLRFRTRLQVTQMSRLRWGHGTDCAEG